MVSALFSLLQKYNVDMTRSAIAYRKGEQHWSENEISQQIKLYNHPAIVYRFKSLLHLFIAIILNLSEGLHIAILFL